MARTIALAAALMLTLVACSPTTAGPAGSSSPSSVDPAGNVDPTSAGTENDDDGRVEMTPTPELVQASLRPANDCDALLDYFVEQALAQVGPWGLSGPQIYYGAEEALDSASDATAAETSSAAGQGGSEPSSTNVQVEGVDEGDIVKAAGDRLYIISENRLVVMSTADGGVEKLGTLNLGEQAWGSQMLIHGDRLVLMGAGTSTGSGVAEPTIDTFAPVYSSFAAVTFVDVSDPTNPQVERQLTIDGSVVTSRLVDGHLRIVLQAEPVGLAWSYPEGSGLRAERDATERNREIVRQSIIDNWLPYLVSSDGTERTLLECGDVYLPPEPSGLGTLSILDFDLDAEADTWGAASVVASGSTVYANLERTYIATSRWFDPALIGERGGFSGHLTRIHRFDTPVGGELAYVASGDVSGFLLNQFAMDEFDGRLRVASTTVPAWWGGGEGNEDSQSQVTVLATEGDQLVTEGKIDGLGVTETIQAVRFMGPVGYVVTFRQTDPLYVMDLSDPANPVAAGELKIPGFSAYLHPVGEGRLLGVGQDAEEETGRTQGLQISLFDVSDPTSPSRLDTFGLVGDDDATESYTSSPVEWDHKAFTAVDGAAYVPFEGYSWNEGNNSETSRFGVIEVDWSGDSLDDSRVLSIHDGKGSGNEWGYSPQRTVIKGDVAYVVGHQGVSVFDLGTGDLTSQARF